MGIGTGLAIIGIWLFPVACAMSEQVKGEFMSKSSSVAVTFTLVFILSDVVITALTVQ